MTPPLLSTGCYLAYPSSFFDSCLCFFPVRRGRAEQGLGRQAGSALIKGGGRVF